MRGLPQLLVWQETCARVLPEKTPAFNAELLGKLKHCNIGSLEQLRRCERIEVEEKLADCSLAELVAIMKLWRHARGGRTD